MTITCRDLDAVGVYFIKGNATAQVDVSRVMVSDTAGDGVDVDDAPLSYIDLNKVVFIEDFDGMTCVCYGANDELVKFFIDRTIDEIEQLITKFFTPENCHFVRFGNNYIVNHEFFSKLIVGDRLCLRDAAFNPVVISAPAQPSQREYDEYRPLVSKYENHPLEELNETLPGLVKFMKTYKRHENFIKSLKSYKDLIWCSYGGK